MHFSLKLADGMLVESSFEEQPHTFVVGDGSVDSGLELALIGLRPNETQTLTLAPGQAFGQRDESAVKWLPKTDFPPHIQLEPGQIIGFTVADDEDLAGAVLEIDEGRVKVDFNHPLAGREIIFEVQILAVENP